MSQVMFLVLLLMDIKEISFAQTPIGQMTIEICATIFAALILQGAGMMFLQYKHHVENRLRLSALEAIQNENKDNIASVKVLAYAMKNSVDNLERKFIDHEKDAQKRDDAIDKLGQAISKLERIASAQEQTAKAMDARISRIERQEDSERKRR